MKTKPLVSIIIPVYNGEKYLKQAINSALNQTYKNIEVIVVNDGSSDNTEKIAKSFKNKIVYIKKKNGGVASALNLGIKNMNGQFFSWLSHDDLYDSYKIEEEIEKINDLKDDMAIVTCNYDFIDENGNFMFNNEVDDELIEDTNAYRHLFNYSINGCALLLNKKHFDNNGLFNEKLQTTQDFDMWFRIFKNQKLYFVDKPLVHSRVHDQQGSKKFLKEHVKECDELWIGFIKSLSIKEKTSLYGSEFAFYDNLQKILRRHVNYPNVFEYLEMEKIRLIKNDKDAIKKYLIDNYNYYDKNLENIINAPKNKIRVFFEDYGPWHDRGGLNRVLANIANGISQKYDIFILTYGNIADGYKINNSVNLLNINVWNLSGDLYKKIFYLLKLLDIDLYISSHNCIKYLVKLSESLTKKGIKTIAWNHEYYFLPYYNSDFYDIVPDRNEMFKNHTLILWLTTASKIFYDQFASNSLVMNNALTINSKLETSDFSNSNELISIGRFDDQRKCAETLIILAKKLKEEKINVKIKLYGNYDLNLVGANTNKKLKDLLKEYELTDNEIEFMGFVSNIEEILKHAKVNILPSYHEGFGLTIIEAASYGIPTIAFDDSGFEDMIENGKNGYLVERNNYSELIKIIKKIYFNEKLFISLSKNAQENAKKFNVEKIINRWINVIDSIVKDDWSKIEELNKISESINKEKILQNGIREYEKSFKRMLNSVYGQNDESNQIDNSDKTFKVSIMRKSYRTLPLKLRKKIKRKIKSENTKILKIINNAINFEE